MPVTPPQLSPDFVDLVKSGAPVGLAVSGGGDSMALLHLAASLGGQIAVASVDHGLRPAAAEECAFVASICKSYAIPHRVLHWTGWDRRGNLQDQARKARYRLLADWAQAAGVCDLALGHTADDQAETLVMALARSAGVDGLAGMPAVSVKYGLRFHRPLLSVCRADLRAFLTAAGHGWRDDPGNDDPVFERIRIRQSAGLLADLGMTPQALAQVAAHMATAAQALDRQAADLERTLLHHHGCVLVNLSLAALSGEQARRLVLAAMGWVNRHLAAPRREEQTRLMQLLRRGAPATLAGCVFSFEGPVLRISREWAAVSHQFCGTDQLWDSRWRLTGPHRTDLRIGPLGNGIDLCPDWRLTGLPRAAMQATPAIWQGELLTAAPLAGFGAGWVAQIVAE